MSITAGQLLLHYRIIEPIGAGGMGEVWKAVDTTLDREVAVKILPAPFAADTDRLARFEREAKLLASINHPNIAAIYGLHTADGVRFLSMELLAGEDLGERLARGPLPLADAMKVAGQVADALEAAHDNGVVHRDLKPANVVIGNEDTVKVLDFGLAKTLDSTPASGSADPPQSRPTVTSAGTEAGAIMGTAAYMSPEQARGRSADQRADIWAFGALLYQLLTGKQPFQGETPSDTMAAVLRAEPDWSALPTDTPPAIRRLLQRCLTKDRRQRLHHIADARLELLETETQDEVVIPERSVLPVWTWGLIVILATAAALFVGTRFPGTDTTVADIPHRQYDITLPGLSLSEHSWTRPALSPDGKRLAYRINNQLMIRDLDILEDRAVTGGKRGSVPFWSPDGAWLAFARNDRLWKVPAAGGQPEILCDLPERGKLMSGAWSIRGRIAISIWRNAIFELSAQGGVPQVLVEPDAAIGSDFQCLHYLPDGETLLTTPHPQSRGNVAGTNMGKILAVRDGEAWVILGDEEKLHCHDLAWSFSGHLLYSQAFTNRGVWAVPFSPDSLEPTGEPVLLASNCEYFSMANDGTLAYLPDVPDAMYELIWVDRKGTVLGTLGTAAEGLSDPALSPDGTRVAYAAKPGPDSSKEIYILNLTGRTPMRLTFGDKYYGRQPAWSPNSQQIIFEIGSEIAIKPADGTGDKRTLFQGTRPMITPDGRNVIYCDNEMGNKLLAVMVRPLDGSSEPVALLDNPAEEMGRLAPQGDYLAYQSNKTGADEIYLTRYPGGEGKWQVTTRGGQDMHWVSGGNELIYRDNDGAMMSVEIRREPDLHFTAPLRLFGSESIDLVDPGKGFDISADGKRLLMVRRIPMEGDVPSIVIVQNWLAGF